MNAPRASRRAIVLAGGGLVLAVLAWAAWHWTVGGSGANAPAPAASDTSGTGFRSMRLWFAARSGDTLVSESRDLIEQATVHDRAAALVEELARGPTGDAVGLLPEGTTVLHAYLDDRGLLTLDLSTSFQSGFRGGAGEEELVIGSLVRTLADGIPDVKQVQLACSGAPLATLGGHIPLDRPLDVGDWP